MELLDPVTSNPGESCLGKHRRAAEAKAPWGQNRMSQMLGIEAAGQSLQKQRKKRMAFDSPARLQHKEGDVKTDLSVHVFCARSPEHMVDPSHAVGELIKAPCPSDPTGKSALL